VLHPTPPCRQVDDLAQQLLAAGKIQDACEGAGFYTRLTQLEQQFEHARWAGSWRYQQYQQCCIQYGAVQHGAAGSSSLSMPGRHVRCTLCSLSPPVAGFAVPPSSLPFHLPPCTPATPLPKCSVLLHKQGRLPEAFARLWSHPRLLSAARQMLGDDVAGHPVWNLRAKTPQQEQVGPRHAVSVVLRCAVQAGGSCSCGCM